MKKVYFFSLTILLCTLISAISTLTAAAQTRPRYVFDNFSSGKIDVDAPVSSPVRSAVKPAAKSPAKQLVKRTVQTTAVRPASVGNGRTSGYNKNLLGNTTGDTEIDGFLLDSCTRHGVDPLLILAQMSQESSFKLRATSNKGARGLMQLMPQTAARFGVADIYDPQQNIEGGVKYMRWLLDTFNGDILLALAGYNAGENAVMRYGWAIPPYNETQNYVRIINARYERLRGGSGYASYTPPAPAASVVPAIGINTLPPAPAALSVSKKAPSMNIADQPVYAIRTADGKMQVIQR